MEKLKLAILNSTSDLTSSFRSIVDAIKNSSLDAEIEVLITTNEEGGKYFERNKKELGLGNVYFLRKKDYETSDKFNNAIYSILNKSYIDLIVLSGFHYLFRADRDYENRVINIHPALLSTSAKGKGAYGDNVYKKILEEDLPAGATVHFADNEYDHGPVIIDKEVPVAPDDNVETLKEKVGKTIYEITPLAIKKIFKYK